MNKLILAVVLALSSSFALAANTEKVCVDKKTKDGKAVLDKAGKPQKTCKDVKVHKKLEGTKVPEKK